MAVKARAEITIYHVIDIDKVIRYYLLQSSTSTAPSKPTTNPPGSNWQTTEPSYTAGSTNTLYFVDLTVMSDETFEYSDVSKSSSYEAAKEAYNAAIAARKVATDYITQDKDGMTVGNKQYNRNLRITPLEIAIRNGDTDLARFAETLIELGLSTDFVLQIVNNAIRFVGSDGNAAIAHIGYGDCNARNPAYDASDDPQGENIPEYTILSRPYYTLGTRNNMLNNNNPGVTYIGEYSIAVGEDNTATGADSVAIGKNNFAYRANSVAIDENNNATGVNSVAIGKNAVASGNASIAAGDHVKATGNQQVVVGRFNDPDVTHMFTVGIGLGEDSDGVKNRANGFYVDQSGNTRSYGDTCSGGNIVVKTNNKGFRLTRTDGADVSALSLSDSNALMLGWGQWDKGDATHLRGGSDLFLGVKNYGNTIWRPYYRKGDSISMSYYGAGFINNNEKEIQFSISLNRPLIGSPTTTAASVNGLVIRQEGRYLYGSGGGVYAKPSKYSCSVQGNMIVVTATMANNTNVVYKNDAIGVYASIKITFS